MTLSISLRRDARARLAVAVALGAIAATAIGAAACGGGDGAGAGDDPDAGGRNRSDGPLSPSDDGASGDAPADAADDAPPCAPGTFGAASSAAGAPFTYGVHHPNGAAAVAYAFGAEGMWKEMKPLEYTTNYYPQYATANHPYDKNALVAYADGTHFTTARDANGHLLMDRDHDGEIDSPNGGFAFHEHAARGAGGAASGGKPFTNFWFDDNWLARYMTEAYGRPPPNGLSDYADFTRWRILGGDARAWTPYASAFFDTLALDGLYALATGDVAGALAKWRAIRDKSGATFDAANQEYDYAGIQESYHLGLFGILTAELVDTAAIGGADHALLLQHAVAIRSHLLSLEETSVSGAPIGWRSDPTQAGSLINTESIAVSVLALGARVTAAFEPGVAPLRMDAAAGFFVRPYHAVSAVVGTSKPGAMTDGPDFDAAPGDRKLDVFLRAPLPTGIVATLEITDDGAVLARHDVAASELPTPNDWARVTVPFHVAPAACHHLALLTTWSGSGNLDVGPLRVR